MRFQFEGLKPGRENKFTLLALEAYWIRAELAHIQCEQLDKQKCHLRDQIDGLKKGKVQSLELKAQRKKLKHDLDNIKGCDLQNDFLEACDKYNSAVCRTFIPNFFAKLPRELREMTYTYLTSGEEEYNTVSTTTGKTWPKLSSTGRPTNGFWADHPASRGDRRCPEHYWREDALGPDISKELKEAWYRNHTFTIPLTYFRSTPEWTAKTLLHSDRFKLHLQPFMLISTIKLTSDCADVASLSDTTLPEILNALRVGFQSRRGVCIEICLYHWRYCPQGASDVIQTALDNLFLPVVELKKAHHKPRAFVSWFNEERQWQYLADSWMEKVNAVAAGKPLILHPWNASLRCPNQRDLRGT